MGPNKYRTDKLSDYPKAGWEGGKLGANDLEEVVFHPIDTATNTAATLSSLASDTFVYAVGTRIFDQQTYDEAMSNFVKRNANLRRILNEMKDMTVPDLVEATARGFTAGLGVRALHKIFMRIAFLKHVPDATPVTYHEKVAAYAKEFGKKDRPAQGPLLDSIDMHDRYPIAKGLHNLEKEAKKIRNTAIDATITAGVVYGASDGKPSRSFFNEARADEYEEEIFFDAPEYEASSGPQFESKKPEYKKPASRNKHETTREEFTKNYGIHEENLSDEHKIKLDELFVQLEKARAQHVFDEQVHDSKKFFADLGNFANAIGHHDLAASARVSFEAVNIGENLQKLGVIGTDNMFSDILSTIGSFGPHIAIFSSAANIVMSLWSKPKADPMMVMNKQYFEAILNSINIMRQEMRMYYDHLSEELKAMVRHFDRFAKKIEIILDDYFGVTLTNLFKMSEDQKEDHQQISRIFRYLMETSNLKDLKTLLVYLDSDGITDDELRKITVEVPTLWLLDDLVGFAYNGGVYSSLSARQNAMFVGDGIEDVGTAPGFLMQYAKDEKGLGLGSAFAKIDTAKLPFVKIWVRALNSYLRALELEAKRKSKPIDTKHLDALLKVIENTLNMVDVSSKEAESIYKALTVKYTESLEDLYESLGTKLTQQLKKSDNKYSLKSAITSKLVSEKLLIDTYGDPLYQKVIAHKGATDPKIPMVALLGAHVPGNTLGFASVSFSITEPDAVAGNKDREGYETCDNGQRWVKRYTFGAHGSFLLKLNSGKFTYDIAQGTFTRPVADIPGKTCYNKKEVDGYYTPLIREQLRAPHRQRKSVDLLAEANVNSIHYGEYTQTNLNAAIAESIATYIVTNLRAGKTAQTLLGDVLGNDAVALLVDAADAVIVDAKNANPVDALRMSAALAQAYGQLIGLPNEALVQINALMTRNVEYLLLMPSASKDVKQHMEQVIEVVKKTEGYRSSDIQASMIAVRERIKEVQEKSRLQKAYIENLAEWRGNVKDYKKLLDQIDAMVKADMLPEQDFMYTMYQQYVMLYHGRQLLMEVHESLAKEDYTFEAPESIESMIQRTEENVEQSKADLSESLSFSLPKAVELIEGSREHMKRQPCPAKPACIHLGSTGEGKSEKMNYIYGTDFKLEFDENGQDYADPTNDVPRVVKAGYGASITKNATMIEIDECIHVDLAGSKDDDGTEADIARDFQLKMLPTVFNSFKVIDLTVSAANIYAGRFSEITKTFNEAGIIIGKNPAVNSRHIVISVTKFSLSPQSKMKGTDKDHQRLIYNKLREWYEKTIKHHPDNHEHYPVRHVLEHLQENQIMIVDVLDARYRRPYLDRLKACPTATAANFDFQGLDKDSKSLEKFIIKISDQYSNNENDIYEARKTLRQHWIYEASERKPYQRSDVSDDMPELVLLEEIQSEQDKLFEDIDQVLNQNADGELDKPSKMAGSVDTLAQQIVDLMEEQERTGPWLDRLNKLLEPVDAPRSNQRATQRTSSFLIPGAYGQPESDQHNGFNEPPFLVQAFEAIPSQLMLMRVLYHIGNKWLGGEKATKAPAFVGFAYNPKVTEPKSNTTLRIGK